LVVARDRATADANMGPAFTMLRRVRSTLELNSSRSLMAIISKSQTVDYRCGLANAITECDFVILENRVGFLTSDFGSVARASESKNL
jgi:hypothetical protein